MNRLTTPDGDYCRDVCGMANTCRRLQVARLLDDLSRRCDDALRYERLRMYENMECEVNAVSEVPEQGRAAFLKEAMACEEEQLRLEKRAAELRQKGAARPGSELGKNLAMYEQMAFEMKVKSCWFRGRAAEEVS